MLPPRVPPLAAQAARVGLMATAMAGLAWIVIAQVSPQSGLAPFDERSAASREAGYELHRQLARAVPGLELLIVDGEAQLLLPLDVLDADETIDAWSRGLAASFTAVPELRIEAELPLELDPTWRARVMSLIAAPVMAAGLPRDTVTFTDAQPPRPPADERGVRMVIVLPRE